LPRRSKGRSIKISASAAVYPVATIGQRLYPIIPFIGYQVESDVNLEIWGSSGGSVRGCITDADRYAFVN
jgi:hypothetical protein